MSAEIVAQGENSIMVRGQGVMSEKEVRDLLEIAQGIKTPPAQRRTLIEAYREALSDDEIARDFHRRNWEMSRKQQAVAALPGKFKKMAKRGQLSITTEDYTPLNDDQLATLKEFFTERLRDLEAEEEDYVKTLCQNENAPSPQSQPLNQTEPTPASSAPAATDSPSS